MSPLSWQKQLQQALKRPSETKRPFRLAVVGIGHEVRGDDAAGVRIAQALLPAAHNHFLVINGGHAPENHTGPIRRFAPDLVLLVDAAEMGSAAGTIRWLEWQETTGLSASTHTMPLYMLARYLTSELNCDVALLGIQPAALEIGQELTPAVEEAATAVTAALGETAVQLQS